MAFVLQKIRQKQKKSEKFKLIIFNRPSSRYFADITDLPTELRQNTKYLYLLNIVDHFSKFVNSYLLTHKTKNNILDCFKYFFEDYGEPIEIGFDNGREFVNNAVSTYLRERNIKIVRGTPYHPRSQGAVERVHATIRRELICKFLDYNNSFNLEEALRKTINNYNRIKHSVTKYSPIEVFYSINNTVFEKVYNNTLEYYLNRQKNIYILLILNF